MTQKQEHMQQADIIIRGGTIITVDSQMRIIEHGAIAVNNGRISAISHEEEIVANYSSDNIVDATGKLVMPGLINAHSHCPMTIFRGFADDLPLQEWLNDYIFPAEAKFMTAEAARIGTSLAVLEMIASGTTCFNDMYFFEKEIAKVVKQSGMRAVLSEGVLDFPTPNAATPDLALSYIKELHQEYLADELIYTAISAHAPYTCSDKLLRLSKKTSEELEIPFHIHLAETKWEYDKYLGEFQKTPTQYINDLGLLDNSTIAAHSVHLGAEDVELFADKQAHVAHNPVCNMKLASGAAPIPALMKAGVNVALGTDGVASNNNLDMLQEMHVAALLHKFTANDPSVADAESIVRTATIGGAKALGLEKELGSLEVGKKADIITLSLEKPHTQPLFNVYSQLVYVLNGGDVSDVIVNGDILMKNCNFSTLNQLDIKEEAADYAHHIKENWKQ